MILHTDIVDTRIKIYAESILDRGGRARIDPTLMKQRREKNRYYFSDECLLLVVMLPYIASTLVQFVCGQVFHHRHILFPEICLLLYMRLLGAFLCLPRKQFLRDPNGILCRTPRRCSRLWRPCSAMQSFAGLLVCLICSRPAKLPKELAQEVLITGTSQRQNCLYIHCPKILDFCFSNIGIISFFQNIYDRCKSDFGILERSPPPLE